MDQQRFGYFLQTLFEAGITSERLALAKKWILLGDWRFKGSNATLELSDFFPSAEQLRSVSTAKLVSEEQLFKYRRQAAEMERAKDEEISYLRSKLKPHAPDEELACLRQQIGDMLLKQSSYTAEIRHLKSEIEILTRNNQRLKALANETVMQ